MICQWRADQLFETLITEFNNCGKKTIEMWWQWRENSRNVVAVVVEEGNNKKRGGGGAKQ